MAQPSTLAVSASGVHGTLNMKLHALRTLRRHPCSQLAVASQAIAQRQAASRGASGPSAKAPTLTDPTILLLRDNAVRTALACTDEQRQSLDALLRKHNRLLLAIRDVGPTGADDTAKPALKRNPRRAQRPFSPASSARASKASSFKPKATTRSSAKTSPRSSGSPPSSKQTLAEISADFREQGPSRCKRQTPRRARRKKCRPS